jgi:hypothetical protein
LLAHVPWGHLMLDNPVRPWISKCGARPRRISPLPHQLPTEYFTAVLGTHRKYSSCLYNSPRDSLDKAEANMLGD